MNDDKPPLSAIIPTLNAERHIASCLDALVGGLACGLLREAIVCDGGSSDRTTAIADAAGCRIVASARGRGRQLQAGAKIARGSWLLFLHADTRLAPDWQQYARAHMQDDDRAACFRLVFDSPDIMARIVESGARLRTIALAMPYGDQGLLLSRRLYDQIGGYGDMSLMEDIDIVRRLGRSRLRALPCAAVTAATNYHRDGWWRRSSANIALMLRYLLGADPERLAQKYHRH